MTTAPKTLTVTESHQLLDALLLRQGTKKQFRKGVRNHLMAMIMLDAGLRVGEVVRLEVEHLYFADEPCRTIVLTGNIAEKGCTRNIPVSSRLFDAIKTMAGFWWPDNQGYYGEYAFYATDPTEPLTTRQVERIIRQASMICLGRPVHPHVLRHTFASRLMRKTNARIVQELLGHRNLSSTQIYTHPNGEDLKQAINQIDESDSDDL